jgi:hypothetical protein
VKSLLTEIQALKMILSITFTNTFASDDFRQAVEGKSSAVLALDPTTRTQPSKLRLSITRCTEELQLFVNALEEADNGHRFGWRRFSMAGKLRKIQEAVEDLDRQCRLINNLVAIDSLTLITTALKEIREVKKEAAQDRTNQETWQDAEARKTANLMQSSQHRERDKILSWISPTDYSNQQKDFISKRTAETGKWLLTCTEYQNWTQDIGSTVLCPGIPGSGKTIMSAIVIEDLACKISNQGNGAMAYVFFNFRRRNEQSLVEVFWSILRQLVAQQPGGVSDRIKRFWEGYKEKVLSPSLADISEVLENVISDFTESGRVYIVLDALDEIAIEGGAQEQFLTTMLNLQAKHA